MDIWRCRGQEDKAEAESFVGQPLQQGKGKSNLEQGAEEAEGLPAPRLLYMETWREKGNCTTRAGHRQGGQLHPC